MHEQKTCKKQTPWTTNCKQFVQVHKQVLTKYQLLILDLLLHLKETKNRK